jgi:hypothetical protein
VGDLKEIHREGVWQLGQQKQKDDLKENRRTLKS